MSCNRSEDNNEALCGLKPILRGTWTANYPQEFFYRGPGSAARIRAAEPGATPAAAGTLPAGRTTTAGRPAPSGMRPSLC
jgi:hypothetical protein